MVVGNGGEKKVPRTIHIRIGMGMGRNFSALAGLGSNRKSPAQPGPARGPAHLGKTGPKWHENRKKPFILINRKQSSNRARTEVK